MTARDDDRAKAVVGMLSEWADWMRGDEAGRGYPRKSAMLQSGYVSSTFEDLCDLADAQRCRIVDACIDDLPPNQRAAIYRCYLASVFRMRDYEGSLIAAHGALDVAFRKKGVLW